jgi:molybdate transport system substrate-binding protein
MNKSLLAGLTLFFVFFGVEVDAAPNVLTVAVASNLTRVIDEINQAFEKEHPDISIRKIVGSTGQLVTQTEHGAPYDVLLAADRSFVNELIRVKYVEPENVHSFAQGILVLWTVNTAFNLHDLRSALVDPSIKRVAFANPKTAPFGRAAQQVLFNLRLSDIIKSKSVVGENVAQAAQFVQTQDAQLGFVALSSVLALSKHDQGQWLIISRELYDPLEQTCIVLHGGLKNKAARVYLEFIESEYAQSILTRYGYTK